MSKLNPSLKVRFDGDAVEPGEIRISHLLIFLTCLNKALQWTARLVQGHHNSVRPGQPPRTIRRAVELSLVSLTHGSPAAVLGFDRMQKNRSLAEMRFSLEILEKTISGLESVQKGYTDGELSPGYDPGVLKAWSNSGKLFSRGISKIDLTLNHRERAVRTSLTPNGLARIRERLMQPGAVRAPISYSGTLRGTNFKNHERGTIRDRQSDVAYLASRKMPESQTFWESPSLEDLAHSQNIQPLADVRALFGTWPGEVDDGFEEAIDELRHPNLRQDGRS